MKCHLPGVGEWKPECYQLWRLNDMRSILLAFTIIVLGSAHAASQVGGIAGTVKDSSGAVLRGARVQVEQGPSAVSDTQGQFLIPNVPAGTHKVTVSYVGFSAFDTSVA
jgi:hypothetical protein